MPICNYRPEAFRIVLFRLDSLSLVPGHVLSHLYVHEHLHPLTGKHKTECAHAELPECAN
eukprot:1367623-Amphidinium_carterae.1